MMSSGATTSLSPDTFQNQVRVRNTQEIVTDGWSDIAAENLRSDSNVLALAPYVFSAVSRQEPPRDGGLTVGPNAIDGNQLATRL